MATTKNGLRIPEPDMPVSQIPSLIRQWAETIITRIQNIQQFTIITDGFTAMNGTSIIEATAAVSHDMCILSIIMTTETITNNSVIQLPGKLLPKYHIRPIASHLTVTPPSSNAAIRIQGDLWFGDEALANGRVSVFAVYQLKEPLQ